MSETDRWLKFADDDLRTARLVLEEEGLFPIACFHSQQAAEKLLKAYLVNNDLPFPKTHDLRDLLRLCAARDPAFKELELACRSLNRFYVPTRYPEAVAGSLPGGLPNKADAEKALADAEEIISFVKQRLAASAESTSTL